MRRLLLLLPWLMERGGATVEEAAARFDVSEQELVRDLELAACCGLPPYLDELIDVIVDDGQIHVGIPRLFTRPLRLTPNEGFALLAAGQAALQLPGAEPDGPLARALAKLATVLADRPNVAVDLEHPPLLELVREAVERGERLAISYYAAARDELTERTIDPQRTFVDRGRWYVVADDPAAGGQRTFRIDRIEAASATGERFERRPVTPPTEAGWFADAPDVLRATLVVPSSGAWVAEAYPVDEVEPLADGRVRVVLAVVSDRWLARLLLRTGPGTEVLDPPDLANSGREAATRLLARYRS
jgi:proteasome accessory factor C